MKARRGLYYTFARREEMKERRNFQQICSGGLQHFQTIPYFLPFFKQHYDYVWTQMQYWLEGVLFSGFGLVGLGANLVSMGDKKKNSHFFKQ